MKKMIAFLLAAVLALSLAACGTINDTEVAILWNDAGTVQVPDSLINSVERAMYTKSITYAHYGANGSQAEQTKQAQTALDNGCAALLVKLVDATAAQEIVDLAKAKNVPVIFFGCEVEAAVVDSYERCVSISTDAESLGTVQAEMLEEALVEEKKEVYTLIEDMDRNADGKYTYLAVGDMSAAVEAINASLTEKGLTTLEAAAEGVDAAYIEGLKESTYVTEKKVEMGLLSTPEGVNVDMILVDKDTVALDVLVALQAKGFNANKLTTHCIPIYTVGSDADYKAYVLEDRPAGTRKDEAVKAYYLQVQYLVDLTNVKDEELDEMVYNTYNVIGDGRIAGTAIEDYDTIAATLALVTRNLLKGDEVLAKVDEELKIEGRVVRIPYTTYTG